MNKMEIESTNGGYFVEPEPVECVGGKQLWRVKGGITQTFMILASFRYDEGDN